MSGRCKVLERRQKSQGEAKQGNADGDEADFEEREVIIEEIDERKSKREWKPGMDDKDFGIIVANK